MEINDKLVFQCDSTPVNKIYSEHDNYRIEYSNSGVEKEDYCIIYFSSNDLYYPNNEVAFHEQLVVKDKFEWFRTKIDLGTKHIYVRDVKKQWYLSGINARLSSPETLLSFFEQETKGYKVMTVGASAGGFAAVIFGQLLNAVRIYSFNGQFEIESLLENSDETKDPIIFRNRNTALRQWYNTKPYITNPETIFYFHSNRCKWDIEQKEFITDRKVNVISFMTSNHGIPFLKTSLSSVVNMSKDRLMRFIGAANHPLIFSIQTAGILRTCTGIRSIVNFGLKKIYIFTVLRHKSVRQRRVL